MEIKSTEIKLIPIEKLSHYKFNRKDHPEDQVAALADLIKAHGFRDPLIVDQDTMEVVAGNGTLMAANLLGMKEVPCTLQSFESEEKRYAFSVSHNAIQTWSQIDLSKIHMDLEQMEPFDLSELGFKDFQFEPNFDAASLEDQGKLDQKQLVFYECPHCKKEFERQQAKSRTQD